MKKRLLVVGIMLFCFAIFTSYPALAQEAAAGDNAASAPQALVTGTGVLQKAIFLSETAGVSNASIDIWKNAFITDVTLGGTTAQCIEMRYSGEVRMTGLFPRVMQFRALVDGVVAKGGMPFLETFGVDGYFTSTAMNWWLCGLKAGLHNVKIQFGPFLTSSTSYVRNRTLTIEFAQ